MKFTEKAKRFFTLNANHTEGFTLVELIVVIAILAILAGVAVPAYSGYINKANRAGDETLLKAVNEAFASACSKNGSDIYLQDSATIKLVDGAVDEVAPYGDDFDLFFAGNENAQFKVITALYFHPVLKQFVEMSESMANLMNSLSASYGTAINALKGSIYNEIGYSALAGNIDNASGMMAELAADESSGFYSLLNGEANMSTMLSFFESEEELIALGQQKIEMLKADPAYADKTDEELNTIAMNQMLANTAVLTAAQNTSAVNADFIAALGNGSAVSALKNSTDGGNATSDTVAQAAFAYAMYTSYNASKGIDTTGEVNLNDVYNTLNSADFQNNYINNGAYEADMDGYMGAMQLISGSASDVDNSTVNDILLNGFNNAELVGLMQNVTQ